MTFDTALLTTIRIAATFLKFFMCELFRNSRKILQDHQRVLTSPSWVFFLLFKSSYENLITIEILRSTF